MGALSGWWLVWVMLKDITGSLGDDGVAQPGLKRRDGDCVVMVVVVDLFL